MSLDSPSQKTFDGSAFRIALVAARFNERLVDSMLAHARSTLEAAGVAHIAIERTPGSNELPYASAMLAQSGDFDAVIAIGMVVAGATNHHNVIGDSSAVAIHQAAIDSGTPIINGITVVETQEQAEQRAGSEINRGREFALAALEMATFNQTWKTKIQK
ncbi:6,7-dimethyl-8-ribityllumazine synthase [Coraliomargarita akajimensis]|nr:6,7-dimethyl-8-ribityllumazine synthase [Coraliomargarita akajimensis]